MGEGLINRDQKYWEARKKSKKETEGFLFNLNIWPILLLSLFILALTPLQHKDWPETNALVKNVTIQQGNFINKTKYIYELEYEIEGKKITGYRLRKGSQEFQQGDTIAILVNPKNLSNVYIKESDKSKFNAIIISSIIVIVGSLILIRRKNKKTKTL